MLLQRKVCGGDQPGPSLGVCRADHELSPALPLSPSARSHFLQGTRVAVCSLGLCCCGNYRLRGALEKALISFLPNFVLICKPKRLCWVLAFFFPPLLFQDFSDLRVYSIKAFFFLHLPSPLASSVSQLLLKGGDFS